MPSAAFLQRISRSLRWSGFIFGIFFIAKYAYTTVTSALFYDFNVWNWFFSPDVAYSLLGLGFAMLLNCAGRVFRDASSTQNQAFHGKSAQAKGVLKFVIATTFVAMLVLIIGSTFFL